MVKTTTRLFAALTLCILVATASASPSNKWRLQFSGSSHSEGDIVIELTPVGAEPIVVSIRVPDDTSENAVAKHVVKGLRAELPADAFHVERDDGEDVLIKKRHGAANFDLQIIFNSVKHVRINKDRE
jgi:hypothetical protein